ncbi:MAG: hypothetical protein PHU67_09170 [Sulfurovum sp.]|nr:hypothetical protein [Sulfurovum sp.]MDD3592961.1 hypothetical protein [Sulfurovum sp.]
MLPGYNEARYEVRNAVLQAIRDLAEANNRALEAIETGDIRALKEAGTQILDIVERTERIDNNIVLIFAKYTPEAKDLRELVSYLKMTSSINRIRANISNYITNMETIVATADTEMLALIRDSLSINRCTVNAFDQALEMLQCFDDNDKLLDLSARIEVEYTKTDDIYSLLEKKMMEKIGSSSTAAEEYFNLLKYIRKNLKIIDRLECISGRIIFARIGGKL